jgi:hypothetical protein
MMKDEPRRKIGRAEGIAVELKAVTGRLSEHEVSLFNYVRIARRQVRYLLNCGCKPELEWKRFILADIQLERKATNAKRHTNHCRFALATPCSLLPQTPRFAGGVARSPRR